MRITCTARLLGALTATLVAIVAAPAAASAAPNVVLDLTHGAVGKQVAGSTITYTLNVENTDNANPTVGGNTISLDDLDNSYALGFGAITVQPAAGADNDEKIAVVGTSLVIAAGFDGATAGDVTVQTALPKEYIASFRLRARASTLTGEWASASDTATGFEVAKGGPSSIQFTDGKIGPAGVDGVLGRWITRGSNATATFSLTNTGSGTAEFVRVRGDIGGDADTHLSPQQPQPPYTTYDPKFTISGGGACVPDPGAQSCLVASLAPGQTIEVSAVLTDLTHFGAITFGGDLISIAEDSSPLESVPLPPCVVDCQFRGFARITDGTVADPHIGLVASSTAAAGNTDVTFTGSVSNGGPQAMTGAVVILTADSYRADGSDAGLAYEGDANVVQSIRSLSMPGATCDKDVDPGTGKRYLDRFRCVIASVPVGARLPFTAVVRFATARPDLTGTLFATLHTASYPGTSFTVVATDQVALNASRTRDLSITVKSPAAIGASRIAPVQVTLTNTGDTKYFGTSISAVPLASAGSFDPELQPASCSFTRTAQDLRALNCGGGELAPGASRTITLHLFAGAKLGVLPVRFDVSGNGDGGIDPNPENNWAVQTLQIVKANLAPLPGVVVAKAKAMKTAVFLKSGYKAVVTTPVKSKVRVDIVVTAKVAKQLGIAGRSKAKTFVVATVTKSVNAGKVTVTAKVLAKYKQRLAKRKFAAKVVTKVVSVEPRTAGASSLTTQSTSFK